MSKEPHEPAKKLKKMQDLPPAEQDALIDRYEVRREVRAANVALAEALRQWVSDGTPDYEIFNADGHHGQYHEYPSGTLISQLELLGWSAAKIQQAIRAKETPLNFMQAEELEYVYQRIDQMLDYFINQPSGTFMEARAAYHAIGEVVRAEVIRQTGHAPEDFQPKRDKITGRESLKRFTPSPTYRPPLFPEEGGDQ